MCSAEKSNRLLYRMRAGEAAATQPPVRRPKSAAQARKAGRELAAARRNRGGRVAVVASAAKESGCSGPRSHSQPAAIRPTVLGRIQ